MHGSLKLKNVTWNPSRNYLPFTCGIIQRGVDNVIEEILYDFENNVEFQSEIERFIAPTPKFEDTRSKIYSNF